MTGKPLKYHRCHLIPSLLWCGLRLWFSHEATTLISWKVNSARFQQGGARTGSVLRLCSHVCEPRVCKCFCVSDQSEVHQWLAQNLPLIGFKGRQGASASSRWVTLTRAHAHTHLCNWGTRNVTPSTMEEREQKNKAVQRKTGTKPIWHTQSTCMHLWSKTAWKHMHTHRMGLKSDPHEQHPLFIVISIHLRQKDKSLRCLSMRVLSHFSTVLSQHRAADLEVSPRGSGRNMCESLFTRKPRAHNSSRGCSHPLN